MSYLIKIKGKAARELAALPRAQRSRVIEAIDRLRNDPYAGGVLKGEFSGLRRIRIGDYRVIYEVVNDVLTVLVVRVAHRREVYR